MILTTPRKILMARFYQGTDGREPVREWVKDFDRPDRKAFGTVIQKLEFGWPIGLPHCRNMGNGLWEIRVNLSNGRAARILFIIRPGEMILIHGFIKKTQTTPLRDLEIARRRMKDLKQ
jgi:phage-related protein